MSNTVSFPRGGLESAVSAFGDEINDVAGYRLTRVVGPHAAAATVIDVESTLGWPSAGTIYIDGERYTYAAKSSVPPQFSGIAAGGSAGLNAPLADMTPVLDGSGLFSALDIARRMLLVDTAEGEFLDVIGRNYGVNRPALMSDDVFRGVIKALAYLPKGTVYALELLLDLVVGAGNYTLFEDLIGFNNRIFITFSDALLGNAEFKGKGFFNAQESAVSTAATAVSVQNAPVGGNSPDAVYGVFLAPESHAADFDVLPSAEADTPWSYLGAVGEASMVTSTIAGSFDLVDSVTSPVLAIGPRYQRALRSEAETAIRATFTVEPLATSTDDGINLRLSDGATKFGVGLDATNVFLYDPTTGTRIGPSVPHGGVARTYRLSKDPIAGKVALSMDGAVISAADLSAFSATTDRFVEFGAFSTTGTSSARWFDVLVETEDPRHNYWNGREEADASVAAASPGEVASAGSLFTAQDSPGRTLRLSGGVAGHGRNNGAYTILTAPGNALRTVQGVQHSFANGVDGLDVIGPDRVRIDRTWDLFSPEDAGVQASLDTGSPSTNNAIRWLSVYGGADGNNITVEITTGAVPTPQVTVVDGGDGLEDLKIVVDATIHTANDVAAAVAANPVAAALVDLDTSVGGSTGLGLVSAQVITNLAGGDDGKFIAISGSSLGNDGAYPASTLVDEVTLLVGTHRSPAGLSVELGLDWRKDPNFVTEAGLTWETVSTGTVSGAALTLRRPLPAANTDVVVLYTTVLSAQILENEFVENGGTDFYPLYLADPFAQVRDFVDAITVAGVKPLFGS